MGSPSRRAMDSYSVRRFCAVAFRTRSPPMRRVLMASQASLADSLATRIGIISAGTPLQIALSALRSSS